MQPPDLESDGRTERFPRVEIRATGLIEAAADLRKADDDDEDAESGDENGDGARGAGQRGERRRKPEDTTANDAVDDDRGERPAADGAD